MADPSAIIGAVQTCVKVGKYVYKFCQNYHNASDELYDVTVRLRSVIMQIETLGNAIIDARNSPADMEEVLGQQDILVQVWKTLTNKYEDIQAQLGPYDGKAWNFVDRTKFTMRKESLEKKVDDLADYRQRYFPDWLQIFRKALLGIPLGQPARDDHPNPQSKKPAEDWITTEDPRKLPHHIKVWGWDANLYSLKKMDMDAKTDEPNAPWMVVVNDMETSVADAPELSMTQERDARKFVLLTRATDYKTLHIPECKGAYPVRNEGGGALVDLKFVYRYPQGGYRRSYSLRALLDNPRFEHYLAPHYVAPNTLGGQDARAFQWAQHEMAVGLTKAVHALHKQDLVHSNIHPENILNFTNRRNLEKCRSKPPPNVFLTGFTVFNHFRAQAAPAHREKLGMKAIYLHPDLRGENPVTRKPRFHHDLYSLGVCLLEIGLWKSFLHTDFVTGKEGPGGAFQRYCCGSSESCHELKMNNNGKGVQLMQDSSALALKDHFLHLCTAPYGTLRYNSKLGDSYADVVKDCLTCLDPDNATFNGYNKDKFRDENGVVVPRLFTENILDRLCWICPEEEMDDVDIHMNLEAGGML